MVVRTICLRMAALRAAEDQERVAGLELGGLNLAELDLADLDQVDLDQAVLAILTIEAAALKIAVQTVILQLNHNARTNRNQTLFATK